MIIRVDLHTNSSSHCTAWFGLVSLQPSVLHFDISDTGRSNAEVQTGRKRCFLVTKNKKQNNK